MDLSNVNFAIMNGVSIRTFDGLYPATNTTSNTKQSGSLKLRFRCVLRVANNHRGVNYRNSAPQKFPELRVFRTTNIITTTTTTRRRRTRRRRRRFNIGPPRALTVARIQRANLSLRERGLILRPLHY